MVVEAEPREAVAVVEGFVGKVVGFLAGQCARIMIAMGDVAGAGYIGVMMAMLAVVCMARG